MLTTLGSALVVLIAMLGSAAYLKSALKQDIQQLGTDTQQMQTDLKEEIQQVDASVRRLDDRVCFLTAVIQHHTSDPPDDLPGAPEPETSAPRSSAPDRNPSRT